MPCDLRLILLELLGLFRFGTLMFEARHLLSQVAERGGNHRMGRLELLEDRYGLCMPAGSLTRLPAVVQSAKDAERLEPALRAPAPRMPLALTRGK